LFPSGAEPAGMNNSVAVVGTGYLTSGNFHAFLYSGGKMIDLGPANAYQASAVAINNSGQILCDATNAAGVEQAVLLTPQ
jgi:probable HAF family extracellular repeat protein